MNEPLRVRRENHQAEPAAPLESILRTEQLRQRTERPPDYETENWTLASLVQSLADSPRAILQTLADKVLEVLQAGSAGLSLLTKDGERFYWAVMAGEWSACVGGGTPRDYGPCGDVLDQNAPLLFTHFERRYPYLASLKPLAEEALLVPFHIEGKEVGTIWAAFHDPDRHFDAEDLRLLESLGRFASAAYQAVESIEALDRGRAALARLIASAMDAIITFDSTRRIELFNEAAENIFKLPADKAIGGSIDQILTESFHGALDESLRAFAAGGAVRPYVWAPGGLAAKRADGTEFPIEATVSHFEVGDRKLFTLILRDVNERHRAEAEIRELGLQNEYLQEEIKQAHNFEEIIGHSAALNSVLDQVRLVAPTDSTVLILGETGTGKELIARAIHSEGTRRDRPLIKVNCAALPASLIESELFGHEKGAFTGATEKRLGRFELANGGTIFLDEIGELPPDVQIKLLRVLQEREFERIGGSVTIKVDIRVIAATNRDLNQAVAEGKFRRDLFYRLNVFPILMPPLRQRPEDMGLLAHYFVRRHTARIGRRIERIPAATMGRLAAYSWPGNIRELENVIERAVILSNGPDLELAAGLIPAIAAARDDPPKAGPLTYTDGESSGDRSLAQAEKQRILDVLRQTHWRIAGANGAAAILKLNPSTLRTRMKKLGVQRSSDGIP
jgi:formate hydrogenlyase transcriptional activator